MTEAWRGRRGRRPTLLANSREHPAGGQELHRGDRDLLRRALAGVGLLPELLSPPLRRARPVQDVEGLGALLPRAHLPRPGLELPLAARVRDPAPDAPRVQRHAE